MSALWFVGFLLSKSMSVHYKHTANNEYHPQQPTPFTPFKYRCCEGHGNTLIRHSWHQSSLKRDTGIDIQTMVLCHTRAFWTERINFVTEERSVTRLLNITHCSTPGPWSSLSISAIHQRGKNVLEILTFPETGFRTSYTWMKYLQGCCSDVIPHCAVTSITNFSYEMEQSRWLNWWNKTAPYLLDHNHHQSVFPIILLLWPHIVATLLTSVINVAIQHLSPLCAGLLWVFRINYCVQTQQ